MRPHKGTEKTFIILCRGFLTLTITSLFYVPLVYRRSLTIRIELYRLGIYSNHQHNGYYRKESCVSNMSSLSFYNVVTKKEDINYRKIFSIRTDFCIKNFYVYNSRKLRDSYHKRRNGRYIIN